MQQLHFNRSQILLAGCGNSENASSLHKRGSKWSFKKSRVPRMKGYCFICAYRSRVFFKYGQNHSIVSPLRWFSKVHFEKIHQSKNDPLSWYRFKTILHWENQNSTNWLPFIDAGKESTARGKSHCKGMSDRIPIKENGFMWLENLRSSISLKVRSNSI